MVSNGPQGQTPAANRACSASRGVDVYIQGWAPGLKKVQLTKTFRDGGMGLHAASQLTGDVLKGHEVRVYLDQFESVPAARAALNRIGIQNVLPR